MENSECKDVHDKKADSSEHDGDAAITTDKQPTIPEEDAEHHRLEAQQERRDFADKQSAEGEDRYSEKEPSLAQSLN